MDNHQLKYLYGFSRNERALFLTKLTYSFPVDNGPFIESITYTGETKTWDSSIKIIEKDISVEQHNCRCKILDLMREGCTCGGL